MFMSPKHFRTFLTVLFTYALDLVGFSIVFPVLAPLLLNPDLNFFAADATEALRTTTLGFLFSVFGVAQFFGAPMAGVLADHFGRYKTFLLTIGLSIIGYGVMAFSVYEQSLFWMFVGRIVTGFCSGNFALAQAATADLTDAKHRSKAFGILLGVGGLGFVAGPWFGGKLANPDWLFGSGAFIFAAVAALLNFLVVLFFYTEIWTRKSKNTTFSKTFKDLHLVFKHKVLRRILVTYLLFSLGWAFFLIFCPTFLVQKFELGADRIGDIYAYMAVIWFFISIYLNKELTAKFSLRSMILFGLFISSVGVAFTVTPNTLWPYWIILAIAMLGGALTWVNLSTKLSLQASEEMQGRAMGASSAMWSLGQIVSPIAAGVLAGSSIYAPLLTGAAILLIAFLYFLSVYSTMQKS